MNAGISLRWRRVWAPGGCCLALLVLLVTLLAPTPAAAHSSGPPTVIPATHPWLGFVGRWERHYDGDAAATVNSGSLIRLDYTGRQLTGLFDVSTIAVAPELWVTIDGGPRSLVRVDQAEIDLAPAGLRRGLHTVRIDVKDTDQVTNRWLPPLSSAVIVRGFRLAAAGYLMPPPRAAQVRMVFYGDSITEGIRALGQPLTPDGADGTRAYANVTGRALGADIAQVGFGKQGVMREGVGNVPTAPESFPYNFHGSVADPAFVPDVAVLLQGSNDSQVTDEQFAPAYASYLGQVRAAAPQAWIFAMEPLIGRHSAVIRSAVELSADPRIVFVSTDGWLDRRSTLDYTDTVHPTVAGHLKVASRLVPIISQVTGLPILTSPVRVTVPAVSVPAGQETSVTATVNIERLLADVRHAPRGTVLIAAPEGFSADRAQQRYAVGPDGTASVTVHLRGTLPAGASTVAGLVRVLVEDQTEALPTALVVTGVVPGD